MDCSTCKENRAASVPYIVHESGEARAERHIKRLIVALVATIVMMFVSNAVWLYCWMQFDCGVETVTDSYSVDMDADGIATYIGEDGEVNYGSYPSSED